MPKAPPSKGIIAVYKPVGMTSHDVVNVIRRMTGERRVGHAGTLDPLASGVLVVGIGREATRKLGEVVKKEKEYLATVRLGAFSTTDDEEGEKTEIAVSQKPSRRDVKKLLAGFVGIISQVPPRFSALKLGGKAAYKLARAGKEVSLAARKVEIKEIEFVSYRFPLIKLRVVTGPGVYIRSLARDIGEKLETGGYLAALERTRVGDFKKRDALKPFNLL